MLHILLHSPFKCDFNLFLHMLNKKDNVMLIQDGVIAALKKSIMYELLVKTNNKLFALYEDVYARGYLKKISRKVTLINYDNFIDLIINNYNQITW